MILFYGAYAIVWVSLITFQLTVDYPNATLTEKVNNWVARALWRLYGDPNVD